MGQQRATASARGREEWARKMERVWHRRENDRCGPRAAHLQPLANPTSNSRLYAMMPFLQEVSSEPTNDNPRAVRL